MTLNDWFEFGRYVVHVYLRLSIYMLYLKNVTENRFNFVFTGQIRND